MKTFSTCVDIYIKSAMIIDRRRFSPHIAASGLPILFRRDGRRYGRAGQVILFYHSIYQDAFGLEAGADRPAHYLRPAFSTVCLALLLASLKLSPD